MILRLEAVGTGERDADRPERIEGARSSAIVPARVIGRSGNQVG